MAGCSARSVATRSGLARAVRTKGYVVKVVVIGGTGLIGSKLVAKLGEHGHDAVPAAPNTGVNTLTGEGLAEVLDGAAVVVDVSNSPSFADDAVLEFFRTSTTNLLEYSAKAGVGHYVALSVVGTDRLAESGYFRAKIVQEELIRESGRPYSIVHATQFFEFVKSIADLSTVDGKVHLPPALIQPMASDDVAAAVGRVAVGEPLNGIREIGGPEQFRLDELVRKGLAAKGDPREVVADEAGPLLRRAGQRANAAPGSGRPARGDHLRPVARPAVSKRELLAAKLVGRWRGGAPLTLAPDREDQGLGADPLRNKRVQPRRRSARQAGAARFAHAADELHLLQRDGDGHDGVPATGVVSNGNFMNLGDERDPNVGLQEDGATFTIPEAPVRRRIHGIETFKVLRGGEYFFLPSLSALKWLEKER